MQIIGYREPIQWLKIIFYDFVENFINKNNN